MTSLNSRIRAAHVVRLTSHTTFRLLHGVSMFVLLLMVALSLRDTRAQVSGGSVTVELGGSAILPCKLTRTLKQGETLEQISWQRKTKGKPQTDNFMIINAVGAQFVNGNDKRFKFIGNFSDQNGTLQLSDVNLDDDGSYTCILSLFPGGILKTDIPLRVLVPPSISVTDERPVLGDKIVPLATCTAAGSKPEASVWWDISPLGSSVTQNDTRVTNSNGTFTRTTSLYGRPTKEIHNRSIQCVVSSEALGGNTSQSFRIQVYFAPEEVKITERSPNFIECEAEANPKATFTWNRNGQPLPPSVNVQGATLQFTRLSSEVNGLYQCEATNELGRSGSFLYVYVSSGASYTGWILFGLLVALVMMGGAVWYLRKSGKFSVPAMFRREEGPDPQSPNPPENSPEEMESIAGPPVQREGAHLAEAEQQ